MRFIVQFIGFRRGVPEVVRTIPIVAEDGMAALERAKGHIGTGSWPRDTDALRVMDNGGRTVLDWVVPVSAVKPAALSALPHRMQVELDLEEAIHKTSEGRAREDHDASLDEHPLNVGQAVSYSEDGKREDWRGGYQIVGLVDPGGGEAQYVIRSAVQPSNQVAKEHELQEDLGERTRGQ